MNAALIETLKDCLKEFEREIRCQICLSVCRDPTSLPCCHFYCSACLDKYTRMCKNECPMCKMRFSRRETMQDDVLLQLTESTRALHGILTFDDELDLVPLSQPDPPARRPPPPQRPKRRPLRRRSSSTSTVNSLFVAPPPKAAPSRKHKPVTSDRSASSSAPRAKTRSAPSRALRASSSTDVKVRKTYSSRPARTLAMNRRRGNEENESGEEAANDGAAAAAAPKAASTTRHCGKRERTPQASGPAMTTTVQDVFYRRPRRRKKKRANDFNLISSDNWNCPMCTFLNRYLDTACKICEYDRRTATLS